MKKLISMLVCLSAAAGLINTTYAEADITASASYNYEEQALSVTGTCGTSSEQAVMLYVLPERDNISDVSDTNPPSVTEITLSDMNGGYSSRILLPEQMKSGMYSVFAYSKTSNTSDSFLYLGRATSDLTESINAASSADEIKSALETADIGLSEAEVSEISYMLKFRRPNGGFKDTDSFAKELLTEKALYDIRNGDDTEKALFKYQSALTSKSGNVMYDCYAVYETLTDSAKALFAQLFAKTKIDAATDVAKTLAETAVLAAVQSAKDWLELKNAILGTDYSGNEVSNAFEIINPNTNNYSKLNTPEKVFHQMFDEKSSISLFSDIQTRFEAIAKTLYDKQQESGKDNSTGSSSGGGSGRGYTSSATTGNNENSGTTVFADIEGHWAKAPILKLYAKKIVSGYPDNTYRPENAVTRAEFIAMTVNAFNITGNEDMQFVDVDSGAWYAHVMSKAVSAGVVAGYEDGTVKPENLITREDAAVILYRVIKSRCTLPKNEKKFADIDKCSEYAQEAVTIMAAAGIINGMDKNHFMPKENTTRAQIAVLLMNAADYSAAH